MKIETLIGAIAAEFDDEAVEESLVRARRGFNHALSRQRRPDATAGVVKSSLGDLLVVTSAGRVVMVHYLRDGSTLPAVIEKLRLTLDITEDQTAAGEIGEEIERYLDGDGGALRHQADLALISSPFKRKVLRRLMEVPRGAVITYQALGAAAGVPNAARAVGNAMHDNPVAIYVPCHRVITSGRRVGGYAGGPGRKLQLLRSEGFTAIDKAQRISAMVWGHKGSKIYCRSNCPTAPRVDRTRILFFASPTAARHAGMRACKVCQPG